MKELYILRYSDGSDDDSLLPVYADTRPSNEEAAQTICNHCQGYFTITEISGPYTVVDCPTNKED